MNNPECAENMTEILPEVYIRQDWLPLFKELDSNNETLLNLLGSSISDVEEQLRADDLPMIPERSKLLLALSRCPPKDVKVVILGHYPISDPDLAKGFALSYPPKKFIDSSAGNIVFSRHKSVTDLHTVLVRAGYLELGARYDCCHEVWAERGVLLLNAALTYDLRHEHFPMWQDFVSQLLFLVAKYSKQKPVFFLCWGDNARAISEQLLPKLEVSVQKIDDGEHSTEVDGSVRCVIYVGHYPTHPKEGGTIENKFCLQAPNQFRAIKNYYSDLFQLPKLPKEEPMEEFTDECKEKMKA